MCISTIIRKGRSNHLQKITYGFAILKMSYLFKWPENGTVAVRSIVFIAFT